MDVHIQLYPNPVESKCKIQLDLGFFPNPIPGVVIGREDDSFGCVRSYTVTGTISQGISGATCLSGCRTKKRL